MVDEVVEHGCEEGETQCQREGLREVVEMRSLSKGCAIEFQ